MASPNDVRIDVRGDKTTTGLSGKTISTGGDNDLIEILATSARGEATAVKSSKIDAGAGDDTITFNATSAAACSAYGMRSSTLDTGDGANLVSISAQSAGGHALGAEDSTIRGGAGADNMTLKASTIGSGTSVGLHTSTLDLKGGNNTLHIEALAVNNTATGMWKSNVYAGSGDDNISVIGKTTGSGVARGLHYSSINAGDGANTVSVYAEAAKSSAYAIACDVTTGKDNDLITIAAKSLGDGHAEGLGGSTVNGGDGHNTISISAQSATGTAYAVTCGKVLAGSGNDSITISANSGGSGRAQALHCATVNAGDGNNTVSINAESKTGEAWAVGCDVLSGSGNDLIDITAKTSGSSTAYGLYCSTVNAGGGDNVVNILTQSGSGAAYAVKSGKVFTGAGNDAITISAVSGGAGRAQALNCSTVNAGDGNNTVTINAESKTGEAWAVGCDVITGSGADVVEITATTSGKAVANGLYCSKLDLGDGYNRAGIITSSAGGNARGMDGSKLIAGMNDDNVTIQAATIGSGTAIGQDGGLIDMKDGYNTLRISAQTENNSASGVHCGTIYGGSQAYAVSPETGELIPVAGRDDFKIVAEATGTGKAYGVNGNLIDMKNGTNILEISATAAANDAYGLKCAKVYGGKDHDDFTILAKSGGNGTAKALDCSSIYAGDGENKVTIGAESVDGDAYGIACEVTGGKDRDIISVTAQALGKGDAKGMACSKIDAKDGENTITVHAESASGTAYAVDGGGVYSGSGDDYISITAKTGGSGRAQALHCTTVNAGDGNNLVNIQADSVGGKAYAVGCKVVTGSGNDTVNIAATSGTAEAYGLYCSTASLGNGDNIAQIWAVSGKSYALAMESAKLEGGSGRDDFSILAQSHGAGDAVAVHTSTVNAGDGANTVSAQAVTEAGAATAMWKSDIYTGRGDDNISVIVHSMSGKAIAIDHSDIYAGDGHDVITAMAASNSAGALAAVLQAGKIDAGNGNDEISLTTTGLLASGTSGQCSSVLGGAGNDIVRLIYDGNSADINFTQYKQNLTLDGGTNDKVVQAAHNGDTAHLGDILALEHGYADTSLLSKLASQVTVKNFEALLLDFDNGSADAIVLDSMLDAVKNLFGKNNPGMSLVVQGDTLDTLQTGGLLGAAAHTDVEIQGASLDDLGNAITYTHYTVNYQNEEFNLYLQTGVTIA